MQTLTAQAQAMATVLQTALAEIDAVDLNSYLPAVDSGSVALIGVPTGASSTLRPLTLQGDEWEAVHRIRLQLWVALDVGAADVGVERAREVGQRALLALAAADGSGYSLHYDGTPLASDVAPDILSVADVPYFLVTLTVAVWEAGAAA